MFFLIVFRYIFIVFCKDGVESDLLDCVVFIKNWINRFIYDVINYFYYVFVVFMKEILFLGF